MIKKILASILTVAVIASVCSIMPVFASGEEPAQMTFATYLCGDRSIAVTLGDNSIEGTYNNPSVTDYVSYATDSNGKAKCWKIGEASKHIIIELPQKVGYDLKAVAISTVYYKDVSANNRCFDYSYATEDEGTYTVLDNAYISPSIDTISSNYKAYVDIVSVPAGAKYLKIARNNVPYTASKYEANSGVLGFTMGYAPQNVDAIQLSTDCVGPNLMKVLASGLMPASGEIYIDRTQPEKRYNEQWGLTVTAGKTLSFGAFEDYEITAVSLNYYASINSTVPFVLTLGSQEKRVESVPKYEELTASSSSGNASFSLTSEYGTGSAYNLNVTMKKIVTELSIAVRDAELDEESLFARVAVSNRDTAPYDEMTLLVAGYEGTEMAGVYIIPVKKTDQDDVYTAVLPKSTTTIRAFLWKDLQTLVPVLPSTPEFKVAQ